MSSRFKCGTVIGVLGSLFFYGNSIALETASESAVAVRIENAWIREAPPVSSVNAGYFSICNDGDMAAVLVEVGSPAFSKVEMHQTVETDGTSSMQRLASVAIPAGECVAFEPGGRHLMLFDATERVVAGDHVQLRFGFTHAPALEIAVPVRRGGENTKTHQHH